MDLFVCGVCREEFNDIMKFMDHKKTLPLSLTCNICNTFFHHKSEFDDHIQTHKKGDLSETQMMIAEDADAAAIVEQITVSDDANLAIINSAGENSQNEFYENVQIVYTDAGSNQVVDPNIQLDGSPMVVSVSDINTAELPNEGQEQEEQPVRFQAEGIFVCKLCSSFAFSQADMCAHLQNVHEKEVLPDSPELEEYVNKLVPLTADEVGVEVLEPEKSQSSQAQLEVTPGDPLEGTVHLYLKPPAVNADGTPRRKRGRPRKTEQQKEKEQQLKNDEAKLKNVKKEFERGPDGRYHCPHCKKSFAKERHVIGHRCWGVNSENGDYVNLTMKDFKEDAEDVVEENDDDDEEPDMDTTEDFNISLLKGRGRGRGRGRRRFFRRNAAISSSQPRTSKGVDSNLANAEDKENLVDNTTNDVYVVEVNRPLNKVQEDDALSAHYNKPGTVPVFSSEEQKQKFDESVDNVDLSFVDHLFTSHFLAQTVNDLAPKLIGCENEELEIFSCNVCKKVFKTMSHMRLHCLIHTDLKPFKCPECPYVSNAKGNLYTHMRKHTGNQFQCSFCSFKSCNRTHMAEHEATHSKLRYKCRICSNDYNTIKSLMTHVRKYHRTTKEGREYWTSFLLKTNKGAAILHQCHVCNRKFKKKLERDRHLFMHDPTDIKTVNDPMCNLILLPLHCELCDYITSRRSYLEKHCRKHRVVYVCCECKCRFLSSVHLKEHLRSGHLDVLASSVVQPSDAGDVTTTLIVDEEKFSSFLKDSLNESWYLPEPDENSGAYQYVNIPEELLSKEDEESDSLISKSVDDHSKECTGEFLGSASQINSTDANNSLESDVLQASRGDKDLVDDCTDIITALQYKQMSTEIFDKIRETFGNEECEVCGRRFHSRCGYEPHFRTHSKEKQFKCEQCSYTASSKDNVKRHTETTHDKRQFYCIQCNFIAVSRTSLWHHQQKHKETPPECPECKKRFPSRGKLRTHILSFHPTIKRSDALKLTTHKHRIQGRIGRRSFKCPYCDRVFHRSNTDLQKHIWIHEGVKPFKCPLCPHACRSRNNLNVHMMRHTSEKPHLCEECGKPYKSKNALRWHVRSHIEGQAFACNRCEYTATQKSHLRRHMETHDVMKRFTCDLCKYSSNTQAYMKVHYARKHKGAVYLQSTIPAPVNSECKVYKCISCDFLFGNLSDMKRHLRTRHQINMVNLRVNWDEVPSNTDENTTIPAATDQLETEALDDNSFQVVQVQTEEGTSIAHISNSALQELQLASAAVGSEMDENTTAAVNIIQQIIEQGAFGTQHTGEEQGLVAINPDSIIVQEEGQEVVVGEATEEGQFVIQYLTEEQDGDGSTVFKTIDQSMDMEDRTET